MTVTALTEMDEYRNTISSMTSSCDQSGMVLPSLLRPVKPTTVQSSNKDESNGENIIVNVPSLTTLLQETAVNYYCSSH